MFCKNCKNEMHEQAVVCVKCGCPAGEGNNFCQICGAEQIPGSTFCPSCGVPTTKAIEKKGTKSKMAAGLLAIFLGSLGVHNFYLGFTGKAVAQLLISLLTCGIGALPVSIWALVEGIQILTGSAKYDAKGELLND